MYFLAAGWKPFNILYITKCLTYNISRKQISIARYYIYRMKATFLIIFVLVAQVLADSPHMYFDGVDPEEYESSIDSMPIIADSVTKLFSLPDSSLINAARDAYSFEEVFNPIRDSLILFYAEHPEEPLGRTAGFTTARGFALLVVPVPATLLYKKAHRERILHIARTISVF